MRALTLSMILVPGLAGAGQPVEDFDANVALGLEPASGQVVVRAEAIDTPLIHAMAGLGCDLHHPWGQRPIATFACQEQPPRALLVEAVQLPGVLHAQIPFPVELASIPDDLSDAQWHHLNHGQRIGGSDGTPGVDLRSVEAWSTTTGGPSPVIAVIDSGVYLDHSELRDQIAINEGEICGNGIDDDGNGYVDDCFGWDTADNDNDVDPRTLPDRTAAGATCPREHGTFISGLAAGTANNGSGVAGLVWDGRVLPLKIASDDGCRVFDTAIAEALLYAHDRGARIVNTSWTFAGTTALLTDAFRELEGSDTFFAMASGNDGLDVDARHVYPIAYDLGAAVVTTAINNRGQRPSFASWGEGSVHLGAPGVDLWSSGIDGPDHHLTGSGTSYAAPLVAGTAALIWSEWPELSAEEVSEAILAGVAPTDSLDCSTTARCVATGGRLDAAGALDEADLYASIPRLTLNGVIFDDSEGGDGDGRPERGERVRVRLALTNSGLIGTTLRLEASLDHPHASLSPTAVDLPPLPAGHAALTDPPLDLEIPLACVDDTPGRFSFTLTDLPTGATFSFAHEELLRCDIDEDGDGWLYPEDCDDNDPLVNPDMPERCNGIDDNCDGRIDSDDAIDAIPWYPDLDGDGHGAPGEPHTACAPPEGYGWSDLDCDDRDPEVHPHAPELCDGRDNNCDGQVDNDAIDAQLFFEDLDGDGWGSDREIRACVQPRFTATRPGDCDDSNPQVYPGSESHDEDCQPRRQGGCTTVPGAPSGLLLLVLAGLTTLRRGRSGRAALTEGHPA